MLQKYSKSRDAFLSLVLTGVFVSVAVFTRFNLLGLDTRQVSGTLVTFFGLQFGFILTIVMTFFNFSPQSSPIFSKLAQDHLFTQIFGRFFDSLVVIFTSLIYMLIVEMYLLDTSYIFRLAGSEIPSSMAINATLIFWTVFVLIRLYRCLRLMVLIYNAFQYEGDA